MKGIVLRFLLLFVLVGHYGSANIDAEIKAIKNAPVEERFKLMNAFKKHLLQMKETERIEAIKKLTMHKDKSHAKKVLDEIQRNKEQITIQRNLEHHKIDEDNIVNETTDSEGGEYDD